MTCGEVREILFAFLDNELDAWLSIEVQRHIEHCPECAREAEAERTIQKRLAAAVEHDSTTLPATDEWIGTVLAAPARSAEPRRFGLMAWLSIAVGTAAVVLLTVVAGRHLGSSGIPPHRDGLVDLLVADFDHFLTEGRPVQIASADRGEVSRWLHDETGLALSLPATKGHCKLIGARKCTLKGQSAALASYEMDAVPAGLLVLTGGPNALSEMQRIEQDGQNFWIEHRNHHTVVACQRDALIYAAVSSADQSELLHFLSELE